MSSIHQFTYRPTMAAKCNACGKFLSPTSVDGITCPKCKKCIHRTCIGVSKDFQAHRNWACTECVSKLPKGNNLHTPLRGAEMAGDNFSPDLDKPEANAHKNLAISSESPPNSWKTEIFNQMQRICDELKEDFSKKLGAVTEEIRSFKQDMMEVRVRLVECEESMAQLETRMEVLENRVTADPGVLSTMNALELTVTQLKLDLNDRDQELLLNDIDLTGITEGSGENTTHVVLTCLSKLGVSLEERDLVSCARVGAVHNNKDGTPRPRPIAVRLARRATRDVILKAARVRRTVTTEGVGVPGEPRPFYVNERLTRQNRALFNRTRKARKDADWKYAWTRDGKIFVRQTFGAPLHRIRSEADLEKVFGPEIVRDLDANTSA